MRKLATIDVIQELTPIPNADNIVLAKVRNWKVVVKKDEFKVGDYCVYFEIDSLLPIDSRYEFLRASSFKKLADREGFRIRTVKLRGVVSQGLAMPIASFPELTLPTAQSAWQGMDVTGELGVVKYDPDPFHQNPYPPLPYFLPKVDQPRVQNFTDEEFSGLMEHEYEVTLKLDGSFMTVFQKDGEIGLASRSCLLPIDDSTPFGRVFLEQELHRLFLAFNLKGNYAVQGELVGEGIRKNKLKIERLRWYIFDIFDIDKQEYLLPQERREKVCGYSVPILDKAWRSPKTTPELLLGESLKFANLYYFQLSLFNCIEVASINSENIEGFVFKANHRDIFGNIPSFKVINNQYLLKHGE